MKIVPNATIKEACHETPEEQSLRDKLLRTDEARRRCCELLRHHLCLQTHEGLLLLQELGDSLQHMAGSSFIHIFVSPRYFTLR